MAFRASEPLCTHEAEGPCGMRINRCCDCLTDVYFGDRPCPFRKPDPKDALTADELVCLKLYEQCLTTYKIAEEMHCTRGKVQSMIKELIKRGATQKRDRIWVHS